MQLMRDRKKRSVLRERSPTASWLPVLPERETRHIPVSRAAGGRLYQLQVYWEGHIRSVTHCRSDKHDTLGTSIVSGAPPTISASPECMSASLRKRTSWQASR